MMMYDNEWYQCKDCGARFDTSEADWGEYSYEEGGGSYMICPSCGNDDDIRQIYPTDGQKELLMSSSDYGLNIDDDDWEEAEEE